MGALIILLAYWAIQAVIYILCGAVVIGGCIGAWIKTCNERKLFHTTATSGIMCIILSIHWLCLKIILWFRLIHVYNFLLVYVFGSLVVAIVVPIHAIFDFIRMEKELRAEVKARPYKECVQCNFRVDKGMATCPNCGEGMSMSVSEVFNCLMLFIIPAALVTLLCKWLLAVSWLVAIVIGMVASILIIILIMRWANARESAKSVQ